jgi:uracil-DNA glycosylase family 4
VPDPAARATAAVPPGSGWPEDPATPATPVARSAGDVSTLAEGAGSLAEIAARESVCRACDRLVRWREEVAAVKRRSFAAETYWGRPVPSWGDEQPRILLLGLAPAAHGGNRTGRIFTGDRSGDVLFAALWRSGLAVQPTSVVAGDGQRLLSTRMTAAVRCAPPDNKPTPAERDACAPWLVAELRMLTESLRVIVCLGHFAWQALWPPLAAIGYQVPRPRPTFGHGAEALLTPTVQGSAAQAPPARSAPVAATQVRPGQDSPAQPGEPLYVLGCYHPSQQNTFTGRVTDAMLDDVLARARSRAGL